MGRATRKKGSEGGNDFHVSSGQTASIDEVFQPLGSTENISEAGALIELADGSRMEIQDGDPAGLLRGLAEVDSVKALSDGTHEVLFHNGDLARLSLDSGAIAFASGEEPLNLSAAAFSAALAQRNETAGPALLSSVPETQDMLMQLSDIKSQLDEDPYNQDLLRQYAQLSHEIAQSGLADSHLDENKVSVENPLLPDNVTIGDINMLRRIAGEPIQPPGDISEIQARNESSELVLGAIEAAKQGEGAGMTAEQIFMAGAGLNPDDPGDLIHMPTPEEVIEGRRAALILSEQMDEETGKPINGATQEEIDAALDPNNPPGIAGLGIENTIPYDVFSSGRIEFTPLLNQQLTQYRDSYAQGERFFIFRGPPGTGKDTAAEVIAAGEQLPLVKIQLGGTNDVNNQKGGYGVISVPHQEVQYDIVQQEDGTYIKTPKLERIPDPSEEDGWAKEEDGSYKTREMVETVYRQETRTIEGAISYAAQHPSVIVIQEPEGQEADMVQLHGFFGDRVGSTTGRTIMIDSPDPHVVQVHDRCIAIITTNEVPSPGSKDGRFQDSTYDRPDVIEFPPISPEESAGRIAAGVNTMLREQPRMAAYPIMDREHTAADTLVFAEIQAELEAAGIGSPSRVMPAAYAAFLQAIANPSNTRDPINVAFEKFTRYMPVKIPHEERMTEINEVLKNFKPRLREIEESIKREMDEGSKASVASEKESVDA